MTDEHCPDSNASIEERDDGSRAAEPRREERRVRDTRFQTWREGREWSLTDEELVDTLEREYGEVVFVAQRLGFPEEFVREQVAKSARAQMVIGWQAENERAFARRHFRAALYGGQYWAVSHQIRKMHREEREVRDDQRYKTRLALKAAYAARTVAQPAAAEILPAPSISVAPAPHSAPSVDLAPEACVPDSAAEIPVNADATVTAAESGSALPEKVAFTPEQEAQRAEILQQRAWRELHLDRFLEHQQMVEGGSPTNKLRDAGYLPPTVKKQMERAGHDPVRQPNDGPHGLFRRLPAEENGMSPADSTNAAD